MNEGVRLGARVFVGLFAVGAFFPALLALLLAADGGWSPATRMELIAGAAALTALDVLVLRAALGNPLTRHQRWLTAASVVCLLAIAVGFFAGYVWTDYES